MITITERTRSKYEYDVLWLDKPGSIWSYKRNDNINRGHNKWPLHTVNKRVCFLVNTFSFSLRLRNKFKIKFVFLFQN
jgi:hypothetical protein